jgi:YNFM family putative membrane transporter
LPQSVLDLFATQAILPSLAAAYKVSPGAMGSTGYVSRSAGEGRGAAGGIYLASYYSGGLAGSIVIGLVFDNLGWKAVVIVLGLALVAGCFLALFIGQTDSADT